MRLYLHCPILASRALSKILIAAVVAVSMIETGHAVESKARPPAQARSAASASKALPGRKPAANASQSKAAPSTTPTSQPSPSVQLAPAAPMPWGTIDVDTVDVKTLDIDASEKLMLDPIQGSIQEFDPKTLKIWAATSEATPFPLAIVQGRYSRKHWRLLHSSMSGGRSTGLVPVRPIKDGFFRLVVLLAAPNAKLELAGIGPSGEIEKQIFQINYPSWQRTDAESGKPRFAFSSALAFTYLNYAQTGLDTDYKGFMLVGKGGVSRGIGRTNWTLGVSAYFTLTPITSSVPDTTMRFLGLNFRAGYKFPQIKEPWSLSVAGGSYFTTTFVSPQERGFVNMAGPQLYPTLTRRFGKKYSATAYFKYSPIFAGFVPTFTSTEIAGGGNFVFPLNPKINGVVMLDASSIKINLPDEGIAIGCQTFGLSFGVSW